MKEQCVTPMAPSQVEMIKAGRAIIGDLGNDASRVRPPKTQATACNVFHSHCERHFYNAETVVNHCMRHRRLANMCVQQFQAILSSPLGEEVEKYMKKLPKLGERSWGFSPILDDFKSGKFESPHAMLEFLKSEANRACQVIGAETPAGLCIATVAKEICDSISPLLCNEQPDMRGPIEVLRQFANTVIEDLPDSLTEFREVMERQRLAVPSAPEKTESFDYAPVPIHEVDVIRRRCKAITDEETHAEVGEIIRRYEPEMDSGSDGETMEVDLARSNPVTLRKLTQFLDSRNVPQVSLEMEKRPRQVKKQEEESDDEGEDDHEEEEENEGSGPDEDEDWTTKRSNKRV